MTGLRINYRLWFRGVDKITRTPYSVMQNVTTGDDITLFYSVMSSGSKKLEVWSVKGVAADTIQVHYGRCRTQCLKGFQETGEVKAVLTCTC